MITNQNAECGARSAEGGGLARTLRLVTSNRPQLLQTKTLFRKIGMKPKSNRFGSVKFCSREQQYDTYIWLELFREAKVKWLELMKQFHPDKYTDISDKVMATKICFRVNQIWSVIKQRFEKKCGILEITL